MSEFWWGSTLWFTFGYQPFEHLTFHNPEKLFLSDTVEKKQHIQYVIYKKSKMYVKVYLQCRSCYEDLINFKKYLFT